MKSILITGVSTGIGYGGTAAFIKKGYRVFGSVRKQADADRLQKEFGDRFVPLIFDVTGQEAVVAAAKQVEQTLGGTGLAGLINNAGIASGGPVMYQPLEEVRQLLDINVIGLVGVTQAFLPLLGAKQNPGHPPGRILNISSVNGKIVAPFLGAYAASKHAVEAYSHAMRRELLMYGIEVVIVGPGAVKTPIWDKQDAKELDLVIGTDYEKSVTRFQKFFVKAAEKNGMELNTFSNELVRIFELAKPKVRYSVVNRKFKDWTVVRMLTNRRLDKILGKALGIIKK